jgi:hypothetical protein
MIEIHPNLLKQHNCNLNICELDKKNLDIHDIGSMGCQDDLGGWV